MDKSHSWESNLIPLLNFMWTTFEVYWICYNIASVLCFVFFGHEAYGILVTQPGIEPIPPALES